MDTDLSSFWEVLIWSFWVFLWICALVIWFHCMVDLLGDAALSGLAKAGWALVMVSIPWFGALFYIITRRRGTGAQDQNSPDSDGARSGAFDAHEARALR